MNFCNGDHGRNLGGEPQRVEGSTWVCDFMSCMHDTTVTPCVFSRRARSTPFSEHQEVLFLSSFGTLVLLSHGGWGVPMVCVVPDPSLSP